MSTFALFPRVFSLDVAVNIHYKYLAADFTHSRSCAHFSLSPFCQSLKFILITHLHPILIKKI